MEDIRSTYYSKFLSLIVSHYEAQIKGAKPGHCMKIEGLPLSEMQKLIGMIRPLNQDLLLYILSDTLTGDNYIHATKLIELRNNSDKPLLVLIPANSTTSAEDSYGDATFQNLSVADLLGIFFDELQNEIPAEKKYIWNELEPLFLQNRIPFDTAINYLLFVGMNHHSTESWGNGLYLAGLIPDNFLVASGKLKRRFSINLETCANVLCDFSYTLADRVALLPLQPNTLQKDILSFLNTERELKDKVDICGKIYSDYPGLNFSNWKTIYDEERTEVKVYADIVPGIDPRKELVKNQQGDLVLNIPSEKKGKMSVAILCDPAPKDNPDIDAFVVSLVSRDDFADLGTIRKFKVTANKNPRRKVSVNIPNGAYEDGEYLISVHAVNADGIILDTDNPFKSDAIEERWQEDKKADDSLQKEQFRQDNSVAYSNESIVFTLQNNGEDYEGSELGRRAKVDYYTQALIQRKVERFKEKANINFEDPIEVSQAQWKEGPLNNIFQFDFGPARAYQIQISNKLISLESVFLKYGSKLGRVEATVSANPTDARLQSLRFQQIDSTIEVPVELSSARDSLFEKIKASVVGNTGVIVTTDISNLLADIKEYVTLYDEWLKSINESKLSSDMAIELQNIDTVSLNVELPDGNHVPVKMITPIHPLRLAWMVNLYELFLDWEEKTYEHEEYKKDWSRKLEKLFYGAIPMEVAPHILTEGSLIDPFQYIGELTFGWGLFVKPSKRSDDMFASEFRQLKSYISEVMNISHEKRIDSDVNHEIVYNHIKNYVKAHPYTSKLVVNLFNAGDASVFALALVKLERELSNLSYEIRIFADDSLIQPGEALKELVNPESNISEYAESFSQASGNRLFPKLRFSCNSIKEFISNHGKYQAHLSFLVNPFPVTAELVKPDPLSRSFYLNGSLSKSVVTVNETGKNFIWNRYYSEKTIPSPVSEFANVQVGLFGTL